GGGGCGRGGAPPPPPRGRHRPWGPPRRRRGGRPPPPRPRRRSPPPPPRCRLAFRAAATRTRPARPSAPARGGPCIGEWPPYRLVLPSRLPCARSPRHRPPTNFPSAALPDCVGRAADRLDFRSHPSQTAWLIPFCCRTKIRRARPRHACAQQKTRRGLPPGRLAYFR